MVKAGVVNGSFFDVMGLRPVIGRLLTTQDDGPNVFVHYSAIADTTGFKSLSEGDQVEFEVAQGPKEPQAQSVKKVTTAR